MSRLRLLALGDAHFQPNNMIEVNVFLKNLRAYLDKNKDELDILVVMGDTLHDHSRLNVVPLNKAVEYVRLLASYKPTFVLVGNHDCQNNSVYLTPDHWLNCLKSWPNVEVVDQVLVRIIKGHKTVLCPYVPDGRFIEALGQCPEGWRDARCIFGHQTIKGAQMGSMVAKDADEWKPEYPMLVSGHIHLSHWLGPNMYYTGSIMQVAVDESPDKHVALVDIDSKQVMITEVDMHVPKKKILRVSMDELEDWKCPAEPDTSYVLYVAGNYEDFKAFIKSSTYKALTKLPQIYRGQKGIKFKPRKLDVKREQEKIKDLKECKLKHFNELLLDCIRKDADGLLYSLYRHLVHEDEEDLSAMLTDTLVITARKELVKEETE